jgi:cytidylate kinase
MRQDLVAKEMRRWELDRRLRERFQQDEGPPQARLSVITVSRQWGSGGTNIAKLVAKELGFSLFDREIIDHVAKLSGAQPEQIASYDEVRPNVISSLVLQMLEGSRPTESNYLRALVKAIKRIGKAGEALVLGRGAHLILPHSFRVRIIAPEPLRVQRIAELHDMDPPTARRAVAESDRHRTQFVRAFFGSDPKDAMNYDIVINTERCSIEHAAALIIRGFCDRQEGASDACRALTCSSAAAK